MKMLIYITTFIFLISCGADPMNSRSPSSQGTSSQTVNNACICTFEYAPVCSAGKTYDNPCLAKCNGVSSFTSGKCSCDTSKSVCAQPPMPECSPGMMCAQVMPQPKTYTNECEMIQAKATYIRDGSCN